MAPFIGDVHSTQYGTLRCLKREPSTPSVATHGLLYAGQFRVLQVAVCSVCASAPSYHAGFTRWIP